ncbi:MAG: HyaD/HybD family hydrogenase maturation endopeptidase [Rhodospirillales bacterium]
MTAPLGGGPVVRADACEGTHRRVANVLVLGVGNILLSDEGIGVRVVEALQQRYRVPEEVEILDGGTCGMDLLDVIAGRDHLILVDAIATGGPPGTVVRLEGDEIPALFRTRSSPHQLGLQDVLALLRLLDASPAHVTVIGVQPASLDLGLELSPAVAARLDEMVEMVAHEVAAIGPDWPAARSLTSSSRPTTASPALPTTSAMS